jgi:hypothetical protein
LYGALLIEMIWEYIGNDRRGPTDLLILLRLERVMRNVLDKRHIGIISKNVGFVICMELYLLQTYS